jgi:hypothetical protein
MVRLLIVLFWLSLIVGTYITGNVLGNWVVCLLALFLVVRSRRRREATAPPPHPPASGLSASGSLASPPVSPRTATPQSAPVHHPARPRAEQRRWH